MIFPRFHELASSLRGFIEREGLSWRIVFSPRAAFVILQRYGYLHFFATGVTGVLINLGLTWLLTTFVFGIERYFTAYLFGIVANLLFNFTLYSIAIFKTEHDHIKRLGVFVLYSLAMTWMQASLVKVVTPLVGLEFYLIVIAITILAFSFLNFFIFKLALFRERSVL